MSETEFNQQLSQAVQMLGDSRLGEAESLLRQLLAERPENPYALQLLGIVNMQSERPGDAEGFFRRAIAAKPDYVEAFNNLGIVLREQKKSVEAVAAYEEALKLRPDVADILNNLGNALRDAGEGPRAVEVFNRALALRPDHPEFLHNLALALQLQGSAAEAAEIFGRISRLVPEPSFLANRLFTLHFDSKADPAVLFAEHLDWDRRFGFPLRGDIRGHTNDRNPDRPLRVGYVSGDFRRHSAAIFIEPLLANHDPKQVDVFAYSTAKDTDDLTDRLRGEVAHWRNIYDLDHAEAAEMIRRDAIDILVDLSGHTEGSRLLVFARKPAPVQVTYLGYTDTTGLSTIGYRFTDAYLDPPGTDRFYTEKLIRLPKTFACYRPPDDMPEVWPSPASRTGAGTFASFNNLSKVNPDLLDCWAEILAKVPSSKFLMAAHGLQSAQARAGIESIFASRGVEPQRLRLLPRQSWEGYYALHHEADILLDTFPVCGHTISCHALWLGLPVVTLAGNICAHRLGLSVLSNLNLTELIAEDRAAYQRIALELAADIPRLADLRRHLRQKMLDSPIMDPKSLARQIEGSYRQMWLRASNKNALPHVYG